MKRILIIEDDESIAELERDYLEANGFETEICANGQTGCERAIQEQYDLVLIDVMLPGMDGFNICRSIREVKETPIIMVTAKKEDIDKIRALGLGADDYMVKPFSPGELVARVNAHISRYERLTSTDRHESSNAIVIGNLKILPKEWRVYVDGKPVKFTTREFELLLFLASNPNIVFSKETLFDRIWGMDAIGDTSTVTVHINRIREKIEEDSTKPRFIETVWGAGYRFNIPSM